MQLSAATWWQTQLEQVEAFNRQTADSREAMRAANPGWKTFKTCSEALDSGAESVPVRVNVHGIRKVWLGTVGRGQSFAGEPVWVDAQGRKTPVLIATNAPLAGKPAGFAIRPAGKHPHKLRGGGKAAYAYGYFFNECQVLADVPEGAEWFEAAAGQNNPNNRSVTRFVVELESRLASADSRTETASAILTDIARDFNTPQDVCEQLLERRENIWGGNAISTDLRQLTDRYAAACPPGMREKAQKLRPYSAENLAKVRAIFYLEQARQRLDLCRKTVELVTREGGRVPWAEAEIAALEARVSDALAADPAADSGLFGEAFRLRRKILFAHPALRFETLLINKNPPTLYSHNCDQYLGRHSRVGEGPTLITKWQSDHPQERVLLKDRLPPGAFYRPSLHPDGKKFVFAYADHSTNNPFFFRYFLYEAAVDGSWVRQLTGTPRDPLTTMDGRETVMIEDSDPYYLPDGGIVFVSTRSQNYGRCHGGRYTPALMLYRCDKDGNAIRPLSYGIENETTPSVLHDGRILYTRWEYVDRHEMEFHKLWWKRPDGTGISHYYGNDTIYPLMISEARAIPGSSKIIATAVAHHSFHSGTMIMIDVMKGENGPDPVTRVTPEIKFPESNEHDGRPGHFCTPYPLSENLYFATYSPNSIPFQGTVPQATGYGIMIVDTAGGREPIFSDADTSCFCPQPVVARPMPPVLPSLLPEHPESDTGVYAVQNVNLTRNDPGGILKPGQIKYLRFNRIYVKPIASNAALNCRVGVGLAKRILGTVPVEDDGSVVVRVPAGVPLQIQALDENGMAVMTERSFHYLHAGERRGCVGCHADSHASPPPEAAVLMRKPAELTPPAWPDYAGGFSFVRTVQPVLDRYCIRCHGLGDGAPPNGVNLIGIQQGSFSQSYVTLARYTNPIGLKPETHGIEKNVSRPMDYYAHGSRLGKMLLENHQKVNLPRDDFLRIVDWLDLNTQANGDSSHNRIEHARINSQKEKELREAIKVRFGEALSRQPVHALINHANPDESRLLLAPLAKDAGGWGQIDKGWSSKSDPEYKRFHDLIVAAIEPLPPDINGTCGRDKACACGDCWIRLNGLNRAPLAAKPIK